MNHCNIWRVKPLTAHILGTHLLNRQWTYVKIESADSGSEHPLHFCKRRRSSYHLASLEQLISTVFLPTANTPLHETSDHAAVIRMFVQVALACHLRVASPVASLGLPEVLIGLLPGAGGTQRLPRLVDAEMALSMMTTGKMVSAKASCCCTQLSP